MPRGSCHFSFVAGIMEGLSILRYIHIVANGYQLVSAHLVGIIVPSPPSNWSCTNTPVTFGEGTHFPLVAMIGEYGASFFVVWWCWYRQNTTKMLLLDAKNGFGLGLHRVKDVKLWNCCCFFFSGRKVDLLSCFSLMLSSQTCPLFPRWILWKWTWSVGRLVFIFQWRPS